jgi:hypothetical protein
MARRLYIVSAYRPDLMDELVLNLGLSEDTQVFVDRRHGERRASPRPTSPEALANERRQSSIDAALREHGVAVVNLPDETPPKSATARGMRAAI